MKVAIITHYYNSKNYGGNLQAYALCKVLKDMGATAEQLSYDRYSNVKRTITPKKILKRIIRTVQSLRDFPIKRNIEIRNQAIQEFNQNLIPHTDRVYTAASISACVNDYDAFITGSDQVWHPLAYCPAYGLEFVPSDKIKLSYAASIASSVLPDGHSSILKNALADFRGISVRENDAAELLNGIAAKPIQVSLDPTLLLSQKDWDEICGSVRTELPYLFCYFLGDDITQRNLAERYAAAHGLEIVTLPHLHGSFRKCDRHFGDKQLYDVSPADFISLIKGASAVFTDSFHATVFAGIYEKEFIVFDRAIGSSMGTRLSSLLEMFGMTARFCNTPRKCTMDYIEGLPACDYSEFHSAIDKLRVDSRTYLRKCIFVNGYENQSN